MRNIISLSALSLVMLGGVAAAESRNSHRSSGHGSSRTWSRGSGHALGGVSIGIGRAHMGSRYDNRGYYPARTGHRPIYAQRGTFSFGGGITRPWRRPVITQSYYNYQYRPAPIVEPYDPVPGYVWDAGKWQWSGMQWMWMPGHYDAAGSSSHTSQSYPPTSQTYPPVTYPQQTYPPQSYPQQTYPPQSTYAPTTSPQHSYPRQTYPRQTYSPQSYSSGTSPVDTYAEDAYPADADDADTYAEDVYSDDSEDPY